MPSGTSHSLIISSTPVASTSFGGLPKMGPRILILCYSTHRQRTQNYIKTLESEVVRLRESEAKLMIERDSLKATLQILKTTIVSAHLPLPPDITSDDPTESTSLPPAQQSSQYDSMPATISYFPDDLEHDRLHVSWADPTPTSIHQQIPSLPTYAQQGPYEEQASSYLAQKPLPDFPHGRPLICNNASWPGH